MLPISRTVMEKLRVPVLKKIIGEDTIPYDIPIFDAQFLIGKSWDVSLKLNFSEVRERHCTIEKMAADVWTLLSHENASVKINEQILFSGCAKYLKCGDFISLPANITFQFKCSSLSCNDCDTATVSGDEEVRGSQTSSHPFKFNNEQLLNQNTRLVDYLQSFKESAMNFNVGMNDNHTSSPSRLEMYKNLVSSYEQLFELENSIEKYKNLHMKVLVDIVAGQRDFIDKLRNQLNRLQNDFVSVKDRSNHLEGINQHLNNENVTLRAKIAQYIENADTLRNENMDLQAEVTALKAKQETLMSTINAKKKDDESESCCPGPSIKSSCEVCRNCEAVMEVKMKLTKLLETEFKCTICDEVFVEAVVTNCGHTFCEHCLSTWRVIKPNCPICRGELTNETRALAVDSYLNNIMPFASSELKSNWSRLVNERKSEKAKLRKNLAPKRKYYPDPFMTIDFEYAEYALNQFYENLFSINNFNSGELPVVDLTDDGPE